MVDGRNIWRTDFDAVLPLIGKAVDLIGAERVWLAPSCSLLHVPVSLRPETKLDAELLGWLAFAEEKLVELAALGELAAGQGSVSDRTRALFEQNQRVAKMRRASTRIHQPEVKARLASVKAADLARVSPFAVRQTAQRERLRLPLFPTTTIGSFPQTAEVRAARARWRRGEWSGTNYASYRMRNRRVRALAGGDRDRCAGAWRIRAQ